MRFWLVFITASSFLGCGTEEAASTAGTAGDLGGGDDVVADVGEPDAVEPSPDLGGVPPSGPCAPFDRPPYGRAPYQGIHGGPGHSDLAACDLAPSFTQGWHALAGYGVAQPNTLSPDGRTTYHHLGGAGRDGVHPARSRRGERRGEVCVPGARRGVCRCVRGRRWTPSTSRRARRVGQ